MKVGNVLPTVSALADQRGKALNWHDMRRNRVVFFPHAEPCDACESYGRQLVALQDRLGEWDTDVWWVRASDTHIMSPGPEPLTVSVVEDPDGRVRQRCDIAAHDAAVVVADRWGQVWETAHATDEHALPAATAVCNTARFVDLQCSECEALDQPVCDWSVIRDPE